VLGRQGASLRVGTGRTPAGAALRVIGNVCIADTPASWEWVVRHLAEHVLSAEGNPVAFRMKQRLFRMMSSPAWMRLFPRRGADPEWADLAGAADLVIKGHAGNWIIISAAEGRVTRVYPSQWQYLKARWICRQPAVAAVSPRVLVWDDERLVHGEEFVQGATIPVHDVEKAVGVIRELWPALAPVYRSHLVERRLRPPKSRHSRAAERLFRDLGLEAVWERAHGVRVVHGLVHGDLKPLNILRAGERLVVIDWGESYCLQPPLFDVLYFLFWIARSHPPARVVEAALGDRAWLRSGLGMEVDHAAIEASVVAFSREMMKRFAGERPRAQRRLVKRLGLFVKEAARALGVS
jgi:Serine/threonine protein kinase involved in cell cycle control